MLGLELVTGARDEDLVWMDGVPATLETVAAVEDEVVDCAVREVDARTIVVGLELALGAELECVVERPL